jgi:hypothetical protein
MSIDVAVKSHNLAKISRKEAENTVFRVKVHNSLSYLRIFFYREGIKQKRLHKSAVEFSFDLLKSDEKIINFFIQASFRYFLLL